MNTAFLFQYFSPLYQESESVELIYRVFPPLPSSFFKGSNIWYIKGALHRFLFYILPKEPKGNKIVCVFLYSIVTEHSSNIAFAGQC